MSVPKWSLFFLTCLSAVFFSTGVAMAAQANQAVFVVGSEKFMLNGVIYQMNAEPYTEQDRVLVPMSYLARVLGLEEKDVRWNAVGRSVELRGKNQRIKLVLDSFTIIINEKKLVMDVAPVFKDNCVFLPAKWVAEGLGYAVGWDEKWQALLIGPPDDLPKAGYIPLQLIPLDVRPCVFTDSDGYANQKISSRSILFEGDYANVYNAGVAADYVNSFVLEPEKSFSFNEVVGERTKQRGFIDGYDILDELTVGGGVCRTSTVLFQVARDVGLTILERYPHYRPVHYAHTGTDASVSWGWMDLKFVNNLSNPLIIYCGLQEEENGSRLWAEFCEIMLWQKVDMAVLPNTPGADWQKDIENIRLCALEKEGCAFISLEQVADLLRLSLEIKLTRGEISTAAVEINNQLISFTEGDKTAIIDDAEYQLNEAPFCLINCNCNFWLSLDDWVNLAGGEIVRIDGTPSLIVLNLSGAALSGNNP